MLIVTYTTPDGTIILELADDKWDVLHDRIEAVFAKPDPVQWARILQSDAKRRQE